MTRRDLCADPGRRQLYDDALKYFYNEPDTDTLAIAPCKLCGQSIPCVTRDSNGGTCIPQHAITSKRLRIHPDEKTIRYGSRTAPSNNNRGTVSFNDKGFTILASGARRLISTNTPPASPPPAGLEAILKAEWTFARTRALILELIFDPPPPPYVLVSFESQAATIPIQQTVTENQIVLNGGPLPVTIDRLHFIAIWEKLTAFEPKDAIPFIASMKSAMLASAPDKLDDAKNQAQLRENLTRLRTFSDDIQDLLAWFPDAQSDILRMYRENNPSHR